jgi:hypothetical protein
MTEKSVAEYLQVSGRIGYFNKTERHRTQALMITRTNLKFRHKHRPIKNFWILSARTNGQQLHPI